MTTNLVPLGTTGSSLPEAKGMPSVGFENPVASGETGGTESPLALGWGKKGQSSEISPGAVYHSWVCSGPYFETVMYVYSTMRGSSELNPATPIIDAPGMQGSLSGQRASNQAVPIVFELFDPDGFSCNAVQIYAEPGQVSVIDWDPFLGSCKFEAGMKHGHVVAKLPPGFRAASRLVSSHAGCFFGRPLMLTASTRAFTPITLSRDRFPMVVLVNHSAVEATVRGRLFCGKRTPENVWQIPANGARILSIAHEFGDAIAIEPDEQVQTYLRMGVRGEYEVGVQYIERLQGPNESSVYLALG